MRILLIDSNEKSAACWCKRIAGLGYEVVTSANVEAVTVSRGERPFALTISRISAKRSGADDIAELVKAARSLSELVFAFEVDGDGDSVDESACYQAGIDDLIADSTSDAQLSRKLSNALKFFHLEERLRQAQKLESIGVLAAGIAHEINTPIQYVGDNTRFVQDAYGDISEIFDACQELLSVIDQKGEVTGPAETLRGSMDQADLGFLTEEIPAAIGQTLEGVDRVTHIVRAMKDFSHPGANELTPTDLNAAIQNTVMVARNEWKYVAEMELDLDPDLPLVPCLSSELNQVLLNMIINAAQAIGEQLGEQSGETPLAKGTLSIATRTDDGNALIEVSDTGSGIAKENLELVFERFFTTKEIGKGTGQGLSIAHTVVVEKHGGTIQVTSEPGVGTTFTIRLPLQADETPCLAETSETIDFTGAAL